MAFRIDKTRALNALHIVSKHDDAHDKGDNEENWEREIWSEYEKTLDINKLRFLPDTQPTVFLCNFELKGKDSAAIKNAMIEGGMDGGTPKLALGSWSQQVVKHVLKDIQNPDYVPPEDRIVFKKDGRGLAHDDVLAVLDQYGILTEIFTHYNSMTGGVRSNAKNS